MNALRRVLRLHRSVMLLALLSSTAVAQTDDTKPAGTTAPAATLPPLAEALTGQAKEDYSAALILYDDADYGGAFVKFMSSYQSSKDARLLWNAAACQKSLRHYAKAMTLVRRFLDAGPPYVSPTVEKEAQTFLDAVTPLTAHLMIIAPEPDAKVLVDKETVGKTPLTEALLVDLGAREVSLQKDGFKTFTTIVQVAGSRDVKVIATLEKIVHQGQVVVHARTADTISFDGHGVGSGTWEAMVASGGHTVRVTAPGKVAYQSELLIQDGQTRRLDVTLRDESRGIPAWVWLVGGGVVAAGAATGAYFLLRPAEGGVPGTMPPRTVTLSLTSAAPR